MVAFGSAALPERRYETTVAVAIFVLVGVRLACAAFTPLSFDESLYWVWSKHIAGGYYDHPPINPILIRLGTTLFGNTEFGVRVFGVLLALPASFAVWRAGAILFDDERVGATAALYFNLTLVMAVGSVLATPDNPVVIATTFLLLDAREASPDRPRRLVACDRARVRRRHVVQIHHDLFRAEHPDLAAAGAGAAQMAR